MQFLPEFRSFLLEHNVFVTVVGLLLANEIRTMSASVVKNLIEPIFDIDLNEDGKSDTRNIFETKYKTTGMTFHFGPVLRDTMHFMVILVVAFVISKITREIIRTR
jgi:large-conductance mechanosensitive channel